MAPQDEGITGNLPVHRSGSHKNVARAAKKSRKRVRNHSMKKMRRAL